MKPLTEILDELIMSAKKNKVDTTGYSFYVSPDLIGRKLPAIFEYKGFNIYVCELFQDEYAIFCGVKPDEVVTNIKKLMC